MGVRIPGTWWTWLGVSGRRVIAASALCALGPGALPAALCATYPLDDSATVVVSPALAMRWREQTPGAGASHAVDGRTVVNLSLDTQRWAGRTGRIYMSLAPQAVRCQVAWTTRGRLRAGRMESGQRVLVYDGTMPAGALTDTLEISISADGRELQASQQLRFSYEVEVQP